MYVRFSLSVDNEQTDVGRDGRTHLTRLYSQERSGTGKVYFSCSADQKQDGQLYPVDSYSVESAFRIYVCMYACSMYECMYVCWYVGMQAYVGYVFFIKWHKTTTGTEGVLINSFSGVGFTTCLIVKYSRHRVDKRSGEANIAVNASFHPLHVRGATRTTSAFRVGISRRARSDRHSRVPNIS